jgi:hypothetical protein
MKITEELINEFADRRTIGEVQKSGFIIGARWVLEQQGKEKNYLICSKCKQPDITVEKGRFDGMCADCTQSEL